MAQIQDTSVLAKLPEYQLDDPDFLREIVCGVIQELTDSEMEAHLSAFSVRNPRSLITVIFHPSAFIIYHSTFHASRPLL